MTTRLKLTIAYDGGPHSGWQSQARGTGVQDHLESALTKICGGPRVVVHGSGRTDAGVHAVGQIAHADVPARKFSLRAWQQALNGNLPFTIRVTRVQRAAPDFHARFDACGKIYVYRIWNEMWLHPLEIGRVWHTRRPISLPALREAAAQFVGRHDFAAFAANRGEPELNTVRTIHRLNVSRRGPLITLRFEGEGFLYKMVRLMTGALVRHAQGQEPEGWFEEFLKKPHAAKCSYVAPADGLTLWRVIYPEKGA